MKGMTIKLRDQFFNWLDEIAKTAKLLKLIEELSNTNSLEGWTALGFDIHENYNHCFVVSFFPYKSTKEMSVEEERLLKEITSIQYDKVILDKIKVFMESLDDVKECEYVEKNFVRVHFN